MIYHEDGKCMGVLYSNDKLFIRLFEEKRNASDWRSGLQKKKIEGD